MTKLCKACGEVKSVDAFHKDRSKPDGLNAYCKTCQIAKQREYASRPPRHKAPEGMRRCVTCKETKPLDEFWADAKRHEGRSNRCKTCASARHGRYRRENLAYFAAKSRKWQKADPDRYADHQLRSRLGLPLGSYAVMMAAQGGRCAICDADSPGHSKGRFSVDHNEITGQVRGLLCGNCNQGIGRLMHNISIIMAAARYLDHHNSLTKGTSK